MRGLYRYHDTLYLSKFSTNDRVLHGDVMGVILSIRAYKVKEDKTLSYLYKVRFAGATIELPESGLTRVESGVVTPETKLYKLLPIKKDRLPLYLVALAVFVYVALVVYSKL